MSFQDVLIRWYDPLSGQTFIEPVPADRCAKCGREQPDLAHHVFEYIAAVMAEPLRRAYDGHVDEHGCGDPQRGGRGTAYCDEAMRLWALLPDGDQVLIS